MPLGGGTEADPPETIAPLYPCPAMEFSDWMYITLQKRVSPPTLWFSFFDYGRCISFLNSYFILFYFILFLLTHSLNCHSKVRLPDHTQSPEYRT
ncbi:hypothetical protein BDV26DRAFT_251067 [Aspergillus bertholletiae]|uniref:Uncharacterized protein n=1 Tax=Aspergillus bertholletiae TaxID=1226010 RepID=A0A5N7BNU8_9EURO|nr:hypothetical protein BDV26DRAFT_251067 [Aspergillus bertholletiae]